jgi:hypothetical protein
LGFSFYGHVPQKSQRKTQIGDASPHSKENPKAAIRTVRKPA